MAEVYEPKEHEISIGIAIIKQVVQNRANPLDIIREALSNSCAKEVRASYFKITIFYDGTYGWSFIFEDDGIGMNYTGEKEPDKQGRLDRFLNLAYSGVAGIKADEFGFKGLGSKLVYLCKKLEIETRTYEGECYKVEVHDHVEGQKIGTIEPPIEVTKEDKKGNKVTVILKGGYALKTSEFGMSDYGILESKGVGLTYAWKGIPYFNLDFNRYKPQGFELYYKFCRFIVECDDVETDIARSRIVSDGVKEPLFTAALREAFRKVMETKDYKEWVKYRRDLKKKDLAETLNQRKDELMKKDRWVFTKEENYYIKNLKMSRMSEHCFGSWRP